MSNRVVFKLTVETELDVDPMYYEDRTKSVEELISEEMEDYRKYPELIIRPDSVMTITSEMK